MASVSSIAVFNFAVRSVFRPITIPTNIILNSSKNTIKSKSMTSIPSLARALSTNKNAGCCHTCLLNHKAHILNSNFLELNNLQRRTFWGVDVAFNKVDKERVRLAGPDRACAEWVLRNGGRIRWVGSEKQMTNYNNLPSTDFHNFQVEEIDLTGSDVTDLGFNHLENLQHLKVVRLHAVATIKNNSLLHLDYITDTLEHLEISQCPQITKEGLAHLPKHKNLKKVIIYELIEVKDLDGEIARLKEAMPWCTFETSDPFRSQKNW